MSQIFLPSFNPALNVLGLQAAAAKMAFYETGTTTLATVYDENGDPISQAANAYGVVGVEADITGRFPQIYLGDEVAYKVVLRTAQGAQIGYEVDPYTNILQIVENLILPAGAGQIGFSQDETYPQATVGNHLKRTVLVTDAPFNAVGDNVADDSDAIEDACVFADGGTVRVPAGNYKTTRPINTAGASIIGDGPTATIFTPTHSGDVFQTGYTVPEGGTNIFDKVYSGFTIQANAGTIFPLFMVATINCTFSNITVLFPSSVAAGYASFRVSGGDYGNNFINCRSRCESLASNARGFWIGNGQNEAGGPFASTNVNTFLGCYSTNADKNFDLDHCSNTVLINPVSEGGDILVRGDGNTIIAPFLDGGDLIFDYYYPANGSGGVGAATKPYNNSVQCGAFSFNATLTQSSSASFTGGSMVNLNITSGAEGTKTAALEISGTLTNNGTGGFLQYRQGGLDRLIMQSGSNTVLDIEAGANSLKFSGPDGRFINMIGGANPTTFALNSRPLDLTGTQASITLPEVTDNPGAAPANSVRLLAQDNGSGKTQVVLRFASGADVVLGTQA